MLSHVRSMGLQGIEGYEVSVECFITNGLPAFDVVGLPDAAVKEARERVRAAIKNCGFKFPVSRITLNLAPAGTKKSGTLYDLPILLGILAASGAVRLPKTQCAFLGELSLQGELRPVSGVLPMALAAKDCGVKIATENMWNWNDAKDESCFAACATSESFIEHIDAVNDPYLVACLDIGHAEMRGSGSGAANMIRALGHRLQALHIHDNDRWHDSHQIPFSMSIDFAPIAAALKEIGYKGWFTLEADHYLKEKFNAENVFEGMKDLHTAAVRFEKLFDEA